MISIWARFAPKAVHHKEENHEVYLRVRSGSGGAQQADDLFPAAVVHCRSAYRNGWGGRCIPPSDLYHLNGIEHFGGHFHLVDARRPVLKFLFGEFQQCRRYRPQTSLVSVIILRKFRNCRMLPDLQAEEEAVPDGVEAGIAGGSSLRR